MEWEGKRCIKEERGDNVEKTFTKLFLQKEEVKISGLFFLNSEFSYFEAKIS